MKYELSEFGNRLCCGSGIGELMDDLGHALASGGDELCMLGGGQPAHIPEMNAIWQRRIRELADDGDDLARVLGNYDPPDGQLRFRKSLARLLRRQFGWDVTEEHVGITAGGQTAFFLLFNALAGKMPCGPAKRILLPLVPEYIGYADQSVGAKMFRAYQPTIEEIGDHQFKYHIDFDALKIADDVAAICVSRPTNPSGNVLTDGEISRLQNLAAEHQVPLIIDNAYGNPFPGAIFVDANPKFDANTILTLSLSKLGLPGTRTGIVVADPEIIRAVSSMNSIVALANSNIGQAIVEPLIANDEILRLSEEVVRPFYQSRSTKAIDWVHEIFDPSIPYRIHRSEGAFFLWLWFDGLPITAKELYERLKARDVLVIPGNYFFYGIDDKDWRHRDECIRITFTMSESIVRRGLSIISEEVARAFREDS